MKCTSEKQAKLYERLNPLNLKNKPSEIPQEIITSWSPEMIQLEVQSNESFMEQSSVLQKMLLFINARLVSKFENCRKNFVMLGRPVSGKSHVTSVITLYAMLSGLKCYVTSLASKRSSNFNCDHFHRLFCLEVIASISPTDHAHIALKRILKYPRKHTFLFIIRFVSVRRYWFDKCRIVGYY